MNQDWQTWTTLALTAIAAASLLRHAWKKLHSASSASCGAACGTCASPKPKSSPK